MLCARKAEATPETQLPSNTTNAISSIGPFASLGMQPSSFVKRLDPGTPRQTRSFTNLCVISYGSIFHRLHAFKPEPKIRCHALSTHAIRAEYTYFFTSLYRFLTCHLFYGGMLRALHVLKEPFRNSSSSQMIGHCIEPPRQGIAAEDRRSECRKTACSEVHCIQALCSEIVTRANDAKGLSTHKITHVKSEKK